MTLTDTIHADLTAAMRDRDRTKVTTLRLLLGAITEAETAGDERARLDDTAIQAVIATQSRRRAESADAYRAGGRDDLVTQELAEKAILDTYLPSQLDDAQLAAIVDQVIRDGGFSGRKAMGPAMKAVREAVAGQADGKRVSAAVAARLGD